MPRNVYQIFRKTMRELILNFNCYCATAEIKNTLKSAMSFCSQNRNMNEKKSDVLSHRNNTQVRIS